MSTERAPDWHYLDWTPERIADFWNFTANWPPHHQDYFTRQVGKGIIRFARSLAPFTQEVVDFGCGMGDLIECLLNEGVPCTGVDSSPASIDVVNERFRGRAGWKGGLQSFGGQTPMASGSAGTLFFVETIEHLQPAVVPEVLRELVRLLTPESGRLFVTTPNDELLAREQIFCPGCHSVFHRYQHVASFNRSTLIKLMESAGFVTINCDATNFGRYMEEPAAPHRRSLLDISLRDVLKLTRRIAGGTRDHGKEDSQAPRDAEPHLYWVGFAPRT